MKLLKFNVFMHLPGDPLFDELKNINMPADDYAVFGSGPLWVRGIRQGKDIDILARGKAWQKAVEGGAHDFTKTTNKLKCVFADGKIEVFDHWYPGEWNVNELIDTADIVGGVRFVKLEHVLEWKRRMAREKDLEDIKLTEEYLKTRSL